VLCRVRHHHAERLPAGGPLVLAPNHQSFLDPFLVGAGMPLRPHYLVWHTYLELPVLGALGRAFGGLEVGHGPPARSLKAARAALADGAVLEIFPEGGRSPDNRLLPFQRGFAMLARTLAAPVAPVAIIGADRVWPPHRRWPRPGRVDVVYGAPLRPPGGPDLDRAAARETDREFAAAVRQAVLALAEGRLRAAP
jgi:1-acyl-sn-glycerol-3-phosphate acyltransferase